MQQAETILANLRAGWEFVQWTDRRMLRAARSVPSEAEYHEPRGISHGSVHAMLLHMMTAQADWLQTWDGGRNSVPDLSSAARPDLASIEQAWPAVHGAVTNFLSSVLPSELHRPVHFTRRGNTIVLPLYESIAHMLDHCAYHRGQLNTLVKLAGGRRVWMSYWVYALRLHPQESGVKDTDFLD